MNKYITYNYIFMINIIFYSYIYMNVHTTRIDNLYIDIYIYIFLSLYIYICLFICIICIVYVQGCWDPKPGPLRGVPTCPG